LTSSSATKCSVLLLVEERTMRLPDLEPNLLRLHRVTQPPTVHHVSSGCFTFWWIFAPGEFCWMSGLLKGQTSSFAVNTLHSLPYLVWSAAELHNYYFWSRCCRMQAEADGRLLSVLLWLLKIFTFWGKQVDTFLSLPRRNDKK